MAIRRPHKPPEAGTEVFAIDTTNNSATIPCFDSGFPVDFALFRIVSSAYAMRATSRLQGDNRLLTDRTGTEMGDSRIAWDGSNAGWGEDFNQSEYSWMFKRAPGFFDVVAYSGMNVPATSISHNLGVKPELVIFKKRDVASAWAVKYQGRDGVLGFTNSGANTTANYFDAEDTATVFYGRNGDNDTTYGSTNTFIAYLFATLPGISKVGSYTGTEETISVDCGFTNGARFVLIKRTDASGNWCLFDSVRGIGVGNDPRILLNSNIAQDTVTNYVHGYSPGFMVTASGGSDLNAIGGTYIFLAIA